MIWLHRNGFLLWSVSVVLALIVDKNDIGDLPVAATNVVIFGWLPFVLVDMVMTASKWMCKGGAS